MIAAYTWPGDECITVCLAWRSCCSAWPWSGTTAAITHGRSPASSGSEAETTLLAEKTALVDVRDVEGFVAKALDRSIARHGLAVGTEERSELLAEGIAILYGLADGYEPRREGYAQEGRFSGYAAVMLPKRLADAWHAMHPEHSRVSTEEGRRWAYGQPTIALEDAGPLAALDAAAEGARSEADRLDEALALIPAWERLGLARMLELVGEGHSWSKAALRLGVDTPTLARMREHLGHALARLEELEVS